LQRHYVSGALIVGVSRGRGGLGGGRVETSTQGAAFSVRDQCGGARIIQLR
jgi:hypothetical protein